GQGDSEERAPMSPSGRQRLSGRHRAALTRANDAFDQRALADEAGQYRENRQRDDCNDDERPQRGFEWKARRANGQPPCVTAASPSATGTAATGQSDDEAENPQGSAGPGIVESASNHLANGHLSLPGLRHRACYRVEATDAAECDTEAQRLKAAKVQSGKGSKPQRRKGSRRATLQGRRN